MRYACFVYFEPENFRGLSPQDRATLDRNSYAYDKELDTAGHMVVAEALRPAQEARIVRVREGKVSATDGPFMETKEILGGFILIKAADMDEATQIAAGIPLAKLGSIEVRPVIVVDAPAAA